MCGRSPGKTRPTTHITGIQARTLPPNQVYNINVYHTINADDKCRWTSHKQLNPANHAIQSPLTTVASNVNEIYITIATAKSSTLTANSEIKHMVGTLHTLG